MPRTFSFFGHLVTRVRHVLTYKCSLGFLMEGLYHGLVLTFATTSDVRDQLFVTPDSNCKYLLVRREKT